MTEPSDLSKESIQDAYEDLVFRKVMKIYAEEQSRQIRLEAKELNKQNPILTDDKEPLKLIGKSQRQETLHKVLRFSKKAVSVAATVVLVAVISFATSVAAFADVRESVAKAFYELLAVDHGIYTEIRPDGNTVYNAEAYDRKGAYFPTYIPNGYILTDSKAGFIKYKNGESSFSVSQSSPGSTISLDTEDAQIVKHLVIGESEALLVQKDEFVIIVWNTGDANIAVSGYYISAEEIVNIAEGIKKSK